MSGEKLNLVFREPPIISDEQEDIEILSDWLFIFEQIQKREQILSENLKAINF